MSDSELNLHVLTDHVRELAHKQNAACGRIRTAGDAVADGLGSRLWKTHGIVSALMNSAVSEAESVRIEAIWAQYRLGIDLHDRLSNAADNYENADWVNGRDLGSCGL
jgi:hypothetical protein